MGGSRFSGLGNAVGLDQKKLTLSQFQKRLAAFRIGAVAKHFVAGFLGQSWECNRYAFSLPLGSLKCSMGFPRQLH